VYIPEYHRIEDSQVTLAFIKANPFAILVSSNGGMTATHLPVLAREVNGKLVLQGHLAKANDQWQSFAPESELLTIFHGPHAFVSPSLYESRESVPTWNYGAVHVYGNARVLEGPSHVNEVLASLIEEFDPPYLEQWASLSNEYRDRMLRHIVAFEITPSRVETKFKISQNRSRTDQENVMQALAKSPDPTTSAIATLMRQRGLGLK
jgi:transcriptional regulator